MEIGLKSIAFTEHADFTPWTLREDVELPEQWRSLVKGDVLHPPPLDVDGYLECLQRCRDRFPDLRILSGVELSEPHWHQERSRQVLGRGGFERVLASMHSLPIGDGFAVVNDLYGDRPYDLVREYLEEARRMIEGFEDFDVLAHVDYPLRYWPEGAGPFDPTEVEEGFRGVLTTLAASGKALEINTQVPLEATVVRWWYEVGGEAITFGSDAHEPVALSARFGEAAAMAEANGFRAGSDPIGTWARH